MTTTALITVWKEKQRVWKEAQKVRLTEVHRCALRQAIYQRRKDFPWWSEQMTRAFAHVVAEELEDLFSVALTKLAMDAETARTAARNQAQTVLKESAP